MNSAFLDVLDELATEQSEFLRSHGVALKPALRSEDLPKNCQVLVLSHSNWEAEAIVWDSGEAELTSNANKTGEVSFLTNHYKTPQQARDKLREWLLAQIKL